MPGKLQESQLQRMFGPNGAHIWPWLMALTQGESSSLNSFTYPAARLQITFPLHFGFFQPTWFSGLTDCWSLQMTLLCFVIRSHQVISLFTLHDWSAMDGHATWSDGDSVTWQVSKITFFQQYTEGKWDVTTSKTNVKRNNKLSPNGSVILAETIEMQRMKIVTKSKTP